jgi:hypothetical protein
MKIVEYFSVNNDCYKKNVNKVDSRYTDFQTKGPRGLMLHSVGCPQPDAEVFARTWNKSNYEIAVHAVLQADGLVYHCLPWNFRGWHAGGSANNTHIGVEMTEPDCIRYTGGATFKCSDINKAKAQVNGTYKTAVELFAMLCTKYDLDPMTDIISHREGYRKGVASGHDDPEHLWEQLKTGYTMNTFRKAVKEAMSGVKPTPETPNPETSNELYRVRKDWEDAKSQKGAFKNLNNAKKVADENPGYKVYNKAGKVVYPVSFENYLITVTASALNVRTGPGTNYGIATTIPRGGAYTIVEESNGWGKLKSGAGWICLDYTERI